MMIRNVSASKLNPAPLAHDGTATTCPWYGILLTGCLLLAAPQATIAAFLFEHVGATDPLTEGFPNQGGSGMSGPVFNDQGHDAWSISAFASGSSQHFYTTGALTPGQLNDITNHGFTMTIESRALQGTASSYPNTVVGAAVVGLGPRRYDILLGVDANGDTVVVLPTTVALVGNMWTAPGASFTLVGSGSTYHTFELSYDPGTQLADLSVDGISRLTDYPGHTTNVTDVFLFVALSGGQVNYSLARLESVSEPIVGPWLAVALAYALTTRRSRRPAPNGEQHSTSLCSNPQARCTRK